jgi:hypothetical protein
LRWVHIDNVDAKKTAIFEGARKAWLGAIRSEHGALGDGRPLFWESRGTATNTYFTLYPFRAWADLDARRAMVAATETAVGDAAVKQYDTGDAALVSPHYSQIWRRASDYDIASDAVAGLTELTGTVGRIEVHIEDITRDEEFDKAWKSMKDALVAKRYPLACRVYTSVFGEGEIMLLWIASDAGVYRGAPSLKSALAAQLGAKKSAEIIEALRKIFPLRKAYEVERRPDLSNLGY